LIYVLRALLIGFCTAFWGGFACVIGLFDRTGEAVIWFARAWARSMLWICGVRVDVEGVSHVDPKGPCLFMSNHQSLIDIVVIVATIPVSFRFVAKKELAKIPLFGWAMAVGGHIFIDRNHRERAIESLDRAGQRVREGVSVILFPEGTRSVTGQLGPFKHGAFHLAVRAQVPIVPISVSGSQRVIGKKSLRVDSGNVKIVYGEPIQTEGYTIEDRVPLMEQVRTAILEGMDPKIQNRSCEF